jgi:uncharacterized membrane protein YqaE (UPF0057 family)
VFIPLVIVLIIPRGIFELNTVINDLLLLQVFINAYIVHEYQYDYHQEELMASMRALAAA